MVCLQVLFHAKSRRNAGATYFVAGRDPAGMKGSAQAVANPDNDLYDPNHGRYVLTMSPGQDPMNILPFGQVNFVKKNSYIFSWSYNRLVMGNWFQNLWHSILYDFKNFCSKLSFPAKIPDAIKLY